MNNALVISGLVAVTLSIGSVSAESRYYETTTRYHSDWQDEASEVFYVEGRVIEATPVYETQWYYRSRPAGGHDGYRERCRIREIEVRNTSRSGGPAGAIIGGALGAHVGSQAGGSPESAIAGAIAGGVIGGIVGSEIDRENSSVQYRTERECDTRYRQQSRELIGYDVRYRYNGREFTIFTNEHPGRYLQLRVEVQPKVR